MTIVCPELAVLDALFAVIPGKLEQNLTLGAGQTSKQLVVSEKLTPAKPHDQP
jgi:hypothetical protein